MTPRTGEPEHPAIELHLVMTDRALADRHDEPPTSSATAPSPPRSPATCWPPTPAAATPRNRPPVPRHPRPDLPHPRPVGQACEAAIKHRRRAPARRESDVLVPSRSEHPSARPTTPSRSARAAPPTCATATAAAPTATRTPAKYARWVVLVGDRWMPETRLDRRAVARIARRPAPARAIRARISGAGARLPPLSCRLAEQRSQRQRCSDRRRGNASATHRACPAGLRHPAGSSSGPSRYRTLRKSPDSVGGRGGALDTHGLSLRRSHDGATVGHAGHYDPRKRSPG
jgi:hypothetical protein